MAISFSIYGGLVQLAGTQVEIEVSIPAADYQGESPRALLKATSTDGAVPGGPFIDSKPWALQDDGSYKAVFDFSEYFDAPVDYDFTYPYGDDFAVKHELRAFDLDILAGLSYIDDDSESETYGDKIEAWMDVSEAVSVRMLKGGLSQQTQALYHESGQNFYTDYILGNKFLTNRPAGQRINYNQSLRLWYLLPETEQTTYDLCVDYTTAGGSVNTLKQSVTLDPDGSYEFILDPAKWGVPTDAKQIEVYLDNAGTQVGEKGAFVFDHDYSENNTYLFFSNSKSGIDDVWLTGAVKFGFKTDGDTGEKRLDRTSTQRSRSVVTTKRTGARCWSVFAGNRFNEDDADYMRDLLLSRYVWLVWKGNIIPVSIDTGDYDLTDTFEDMLVNDELEFVLTEAHNDNYF